MKRAASTILYVVISTAGVTAFLAPFWTTADGGAPGADAPLMTALLITFALIAMLLDAQSAELGVKQIAMLGVLAAINSALRFAEVALPGPGGFTPIFLLILCGGFAYGPRFGFLLGALSLLASAMVTAGVGPWLPFQMFTAGWMGLSAGWLGALDTGASVHLSRRAHATLIAFGTAWGFAYGAIMNLWSWPYTLDHAALSGPLDVLRRYAAYYVATSALWDLFGALGNALLLALFAPATLRALLRLRARMTFEVAIP